MDVCRVNSLLTRRRMLALGVTAASSVMVPGVLGASFADAQSAETGQDGAGGFSPPPSHVISAIEQIIQAQGSVSDGVYSIGIDRDDMNNVTHGSIAIQPAFAVSGDLYFQRNDDNSVSMNADIPLKASEMDAFIHELITHNITFQAEHQHFYDFSPVVWFVHFRAKGDALQIARGIKAALDVTSTPFPQKKPSHPTTPLPAAELGAILGAKPSIGDDGIVSFNVPRAEQIRLGGVRVSPYLNEATSIKFQPYGGGQGAAAIPDFGMVASEINNVVGLMQKQGWDIGCLYNQETDESPQLYFSHQFKAGDAIELAKDIRAGLDLTNVRFKT